MIYLMRHGADSPDRCGGWSPYGLTDKGINQVHAVGKSFRCKGIEAIFSSDLLRAKESAEIVAAYLQLPVTYLPQFRETNNGALAGMLKTEAKKRIPASTEVGWTGVSPIPAVKARHSFSAGLKRHGKTSKPTSAIARFCWSPTAE